MQKIDLAIKRFTFSNLITESVRKEHDLYLYDRSNIIGTDELNLFYIFLQQMYRWDCSNPEQTTIYIRNKNGVIISGLFLLDKNQEFSAAVQYT